VPRIQFGRTRANVIGQILNDASPHDMPFRQPTKFQLIINVKTAKALGLEMPSTMLLRADKVIEQCSLFCCST
jgi:putative tryptophan/tyrosine transport system substrate-binding protein